MAKPVKNPSQSRTTTKTTTRSELDALSDELHGATDAGEGKPVKTSPAEKREQKERESEAKEKAKEQFYKSQAETAVRLLEESGKPFVAGIALGTDAARYFKTPEHKWRMLVDPLASYLKAVQFEPESPMYHLVLLLTMWGFITYEQFSEYTASRPKVAAQQPQPQEKPGWTGSIAKTVSSFL